MFKFLKKQEEKAPPPREKEKEKEEENSFTISVGREGQPIIRVSLQNTEDEDIEPFVKAVFAAQIGLYKNQLLEIFEEMRSSGYYATKDDFMKKLIALYGGYFALAETTDYNKKENKPVISPLKFSSLIQGDK